MKWLQNNLVFLTKHGSQCYGLANELSDLDMKGICVPPREVENNLFHRFEQVENDPTVHGIFDHLKNPKNPKMESTIFSLKKFMVLAANVNPNIIELLWVDPSDYLVMTPTMEKLMEHKNWFLSTKAKFAFGGYAYAQLAKIERHRKWIVLGDLKEPKREDYGLSSVRARQLDEVFGFIKSEVEKWNLTKYPMDEMNRSELKETIWDLLYNTSQLEVGWDNWPQAYETAVVEKIAREYDLKEEVVMLLHKEREYKRDMEQYRSWKNWKQNRNPERHKLEEKSGYDSKHASHLVRLMRMGYEILTDHKVVVKRPDREEILAVKNGEWTYDQVMEFAHSMQSKLDDAYKVSTLPKSVDYEKINQLYHSMYEEFHSLNGIINRLK